MGIGKLLGKPNKLWGDDLRWTSIPSRGSRNTPSRFMLQKPGQGFIHLIGISAVKNKIILFSAYLKMLYLTLRIQQKATIRDHLDVILVAFLSKTCCCLQQRFERFKYQCNCFFYDLFSSSFFLLNAR